MAQLTRGVIDSEHFVARYAQGKLTGPELEAFEEFCLMHPEVAKQVAADRNLIEGLRGMEEPAPARASRGWLPYALAAGLAALAAVAFSSYFRAHGTAGLLAAATTPPAVAGTHPAGPFRVVRLRSGSVQTFQVPRGTNSIMLDIEPSDTAGATAIDVTLLANVEEKWEPRGSLSRLPARADGTFALTVQVTTLEGELLRVSCRSLDGRVDDFDFRVVPAE